MSEPAENTQTHPMAEDLLKRLAHNANGGFLRTAWPKNVLIVLAAEVLSLRNRLSVLEAKCAAENKDK